MISETKQLSTKYVKNKKEQHHGVLTTLHDEATHDRTDVMLFESVVGITA